MSKINGNFPSSLQEPRVLLATAKGVGADLRQTNGINTWDKNQCHYTEGWRRPATHKDHVETNAVMIGSLFCVCKAISPGRPFIRRFIDLTFGVVKSYYKIILTVGAKSDLNMWLLNLKEFNGVSIDCVLPMTSCSSSLMQVEDRFGGGGVCQAMVSGEVARVSVTSKVAMVLWGKSLRGKRIVDI